ncbi:hypothetical protein CXF59_05455 [Flavobacterium sp. ALD4]|jgi:hypothetical protein|uniref:hypothetical protein n=1 Tax=Flavobacterium sp. ALD4 TaxID=2058314 RepID=UPI000C34BC44|nr:hypothetical protein [Flavobacterium sp. ALD4]PKH67926.1 hypothetical protein CXF59_05455 [Flavobacterium sp. ALD4]
MANKELERNQEYQKEYIEGIEMMIYMSSHQIRQPIVNIPGSSQLIHLSTETKLDLKQTLDYIKHLPNPLIN